MKAAEVTDNDHADGPADAAVTLIEYGDYECPYCVRGYPVIEAVRRNYPTKLRFVYRHVPKARASGFSKQAAEAAEFAAAAGKFWPMHEQLFTHTEQHDVDHLVEYARCVDLDPEAMRAALLERRFAARVTELTVAAVRSGIIGTPTLFINGARYEDRLEEAPLRAAIDAAG